MLVEHTDLPKRGILSVDFLFQASEEFREIVGENLWSIYFEVLDNFDTWDHQSSNIGSIETLEPNFIKNRQKMIFKPFFHSQHVGTIDFRIHVPLSKLTELSQNSQRHLCHLYHLRVAWA